MKQIFLRLVGIGIYLLLVLWLLDFRLQLLFDSKSLLLVSAGTVLLTAGSYKKNITAAELREHAMWNSVISGLLTTFMLLFTTLYQNVSGTQLLPKLALCMRPLFYTLVIQILCRPLSGEAATPKKPCNGSTLSDDTSAEAARIGTDTVPVSAPEYSALTLDEVRYLLREKSLTDRELEIALAIWKNLSVKEIAEELFISESTVKKHTTSLYKKLQVENREQLKQYLNTLFQSKV